MMTQTFKKILCLSLLSTLALLPISSWAQDMAATSTRVGDYIVHHSVFNSSFLTPEIAGIYGLTRGADKAIVNVAVTDANAGASSFGLPVQVSGMARNLMQQQTKLVFQTIEEADATYYIALFEFDDQEIMHFDIDVTLPGAARAKEINFTKKMYED